MFSLLQLECIISPKGLSVVFQPLHLGLDVFTYDGLRGIHERYCATGDRSEESLSSRGVLAVKFELRFCII